MTARARAPTQARRFYVNALSQAEKADFNKALKVEGVDQEVAVLRLRLRTAIAEHPEDLELMVHGITLLVRALAAKYRLPAADADELAAAVISEIEGPLWPREDADERHVG
jgi:hypothetical protein